MWRSWLKSPASLRSFTKDVHRVFIPFCDVQIQKWIFRFIRNFLRFIRNSFLGNAPSEYFCKLRKLVSSLVWGYSFHQNCFFEKHKKGLVGPIYGHFKSFYIYWQAFNYFASLFLRGDSKARSPVRESVVLPILTLVYLPSKTGVIFG